MTDTLTASTFVPAPVAPPRKGSLLDVATVRDVAHTTAALGAQWDAEVCGNVSSYEPTVECLDLPGPATKTVIGVSIQAATPFVVYAVVACGMLVGNDRYAKRARALMDGRESFGVEERLSKRWVADATGTYVTTPLTIVEAIGAAEDLLATNYAGSGIIHLTPIQATRAAAAHLLTWDAVPGELTTLLGTRVAVGAGYKAASGTIHGSTTPTATQGWLFVTGWITLDRSPLVEATADDLIENTRYALAERSYLPFVDCFVGGVLAA